MFAAVGSGGGTTGGDEKQQQQQQEQEEQQELPQLTCTAVQLHRTTAAIDLVHVACPQDGAFSRGKQQCDLWEFVWGASLMLSELLLTVAPPPPASPQPLQPVDVVTTAITGGGGGEPRQHHVCRRCSNTF
jgi:hypothetical protein